MFVFRRRDPDQKVPFKVPGHPFTTAFFVIACWTVVIATVVNNPLNAMIGYAILGAGIPACLYWQRSKTRS